VKRKFFFFIFILFPFTAFSETKNYEINATTSISARIYPVDQMPAIVDENVDIYGLLEFRYFPVDYFQFYLRERILIDPLQSARNRYAPLDFYFDLISDHVDFRLGQMIESWKISDTFTPGDILNRRDPQYNFYFPDKLGDLMARLRFLLPEGENITNTALSFYFLPLDLETPLPENNSRFRFSPTGGIGILDEDNSIHSNNYINRLGYAVRLTTVIRNIDLFSFYYGGPSRIPSFFLNSSALLNPVYYRVDLLGGGFQWAIDRFLLKGEITYTWTDNNGLTAPFSLVVPAPYLQFVVGFDYTFNNLFFKEAITFTLEYAGEDDHDSMLTGLRPYKNDLIMGIQYDLNDFSQTQFKGTLSVDLGNGETLMELTLNRKIYKELKAQIGGTLIIRETDEFTPWGIFPNNSSISFGLSHAF